jgi:protein gp37
MATATAEWTDVTWNPVRGCVKVSPGCASCWAERFAERFRGVDGHPFQQGFDLRFVPGALDQPARWRTPRRVLVTSMSDLFLDAIPDDYIEQVFSVIRDNPRHTFQILTKRSERLADLAPRLTWPENLWMGVSVESDGYTWRIVDLARVPAAVRFVSFEPLLGPIPDPPLTGVHWVLAGGESGPGARPTEADWVRALRDRCADQGVPFYFRHWSGLRRDRRELDGRTHDAMPGVAAT